MIAVFVNCIAIILGSIIGLLFSKKMSGELKSVITTAAGVVTLVLGFQMALAYKNIIYMILSLIIGGVLGYFADIDGKILTFGRFLEKHLYHKKIAQEISVNKELPPNQKNFAYAFLNASVLFCVGAMAI